MGGHARKESILSYYLRFMMFASLALRKNQTGWSGCELKNLANEGTTLDKEFVDTFEHQTSSSLKEEEMKAKMEIYDFLECPSEAMPGRGD